jgi:hypothetical protein
MDRGQLNKWRKTPMGDLEHLTEKGKNRLVKPLKYGSCGLRVV